MIEFSMNLQDYVTINGHNKVLQYFTVYDGTLSVLRDKPIRLLEIGVFKGESMRMWEAYFPFAEIIGLDIDPECVKYQNDRVKIVIGDQRDECLLQSLGVFNIIIDDGGHNPDEQMKSFEILYPFLNHGGWYFIEDIHGGYHAQENTTQKFFKELVDCVAVPMVFNKYMVSEIRFINNMAAIRK